MGYNFFVKQDIEERRRYQSLLEIIASLSGLFSESDHPFLYYRAMENVFCKSFHADDYSRSDISADAGKEGLGIGLKTFLHSNGRTFQKVAEFNKDSANFKGLKAKHLIHEIAESRNNRIETTKRMLNLDEMMYHMITRSKNKLHIFEEKMDLIDIKNIKEIKETKSSLHFEDGLHEYNYNKSKSTLLKRFITIESKAIRTFKVKILKDPFDLLLSLNKVQEDQSSLIEEDKDRISDNIILPLYSPRDGEVKERSGLNQWNARGRKRDPNEVYIPIPAWIHRKKPRFFINQTEDNKTAPFNVTLPNKKKLSMRVAQAGGKALMSDPNKELGNWLLRDVMQLYPGTIVTRKFLDKIGIDSVKLSKTEDNEFYLDFLKSGSYEEFLQDVEER